MNLFLVHCNCNCSINNEVQTKWSGYLLDQYMTLMILAPFGLKHSGQGEIIGTWPRPTFLHLPEATSMTRRSDGELLDGMMWKGCGLDEWWWIGGCRIVNRYSN
jgi:hypothetical protein